MRVELDGVIFRFHFEDQDDRSIWEDMYFDDSLIMYDCCECETSLNYKYRMIITLLEEANLLPVDFKHYCCHCSFLHNVGLLDLRGRLATAKVFGDMIALGFVLKINSQFKDVEVRVHDYKRFLE